MIQDMYQFKPPLPFSPGAEVAGTVSAVGDGVDALAVGDRVLASPGWGGLAEKVALDARAAIEGPGRHRSRARVVVPLRVRHLALRVEGSRSAAAR